MASQQLTLILPAFSVVVANPINQSFLPQSLKILMKRGTFIESEDRFFQQLLSLFSEETRYWDDFPMARLRGGTEFTLCVDPCYLQADRDQLLLFHHGLDISMDEAEQLIASIQYLFDDLGASLSINTANQWLLSMPIEPDIELTCVDKVDRRAVTEFLPKGADARLWIRLWNEIQMVLFDCPVNQAREAQGKVPINSVWFWGKEKMPDEWQTWSHVSGQDETLKQLSHYSGSEWLENIDHFTDIQAKHALHLAHFDPDKDWSTQMEVLDKNWLTPIYKALKRFQLDSVHIVIPEWGTYHLTPTSAWKIWL
jgi:hypothetical protein